MQGLPDGLMEEVYSKVRLDIDDVSTFVRSDCFKEAVDAALTLNRITADLQALGISRSADQPGTQQANETVQMIIQGPERRQPPLTTIAQETTEKLPLKPETNWEMCAVALVKEIQEELCLY